MNHEQIWGAIESFAAMHKLSCSGLARAGRLDPTTFNRSKRWSREGQPRWPNMQSIAKILTATGASVDEFVRLIDDSARAAPNSQLGADGSVSGITPNADNSAKEIIA